MSFITAVVIYLAILTILGYILGRQGTSMDFYLAGRNSKWWAVAFGMVGTTLSGITFISVPGWTLTNNWHYLQMVFGYVLGYWVIALVLLPVYYRYNVTTVYEVLVPTLGIHGRRAGAILFLIARIIGASLRLYIVAFVMYEFIMGRTLPFPLLVFILVSIMWIYTFQGGIKTIVWTDVVQTVAMLSALIITIFVAFDIAELSFISLLEMPNAEIFDWNPESPSYFWKYFISGALFAIVMTGLDQDMMQKNLSCPSLRDSQKNVFTFSILLVLVNILFLFLGLVLIGYAKQFNIPLPEKSDALYPMLAIRHMPQIAGISFLVGLVAAALSSADSAITGLTTSVMVDFDKEGKWNRKMVHLAMALIIGIMATTFFVLHNDAVISMLFKYSAYFYGPLLGLFVYAMLKFKRPGHLWLWLSVIVSPILTIVLEYLISAYTGYKFSFEHILLIAAITFFILLIGGKLHRL